MPSCLRYCADIGMPAFDRGKTTCIHRTEYCNKHCYNVKLYRVYPAMKGRDDKNDAYWLNTSATDFAYEVRTACKRAGVNRFRWATRGEAIGVQADLHKVFNIVDLCPDIEFWLPTRAWRNVDMRALIDVYRRSSDNVRILASLDPSNTEEERCGLVSDGWSTMTFGADFIDDYNIMCPKTYGKHKGACATCTIGCFNREQTHVHMKEH